MKPSEWQEANRIIGKMQDELENLQKPNSNGTATTAKNLTPTIKELVNARNVLSRIADDLISENIKKTRSGSRSRSGSYQSGGESVYETGTKANGLVRPKSNKKTRKHLVKKSRKRGRR